MERLIRQSGSHEIGYYRIGITPEMRELAMAAARQSMDNGIGFKYNTPRESSRVFDGKLGEKVKLQRLYIGKLGKLAFAALLEARGKDIALSSAVDAESGQHEQGSDFVTSTGRTINIVTTHGATSEGEVRKYLVVLQRALEEAPADYYVGVWLNTKEDRDGIVDVEDIDFAYIHGYVAYDFLTQRTKLMEGFIEGPSRTVPMDRLMGIDKVIKEF